MLFRRVINRTKLILEKYDQENADHKHSDQENADQQKTGQTNHDQMHADQKAC